MRRFTITTLILAMVLGAVLAWLAAPAYRLHAALRAIGDTDAAARERGWSFLLDSPADGRPPRAESMLPELSRRLAEAEDDALLDGTAALRRIDRWGWSHQPHRLILRELRLRAAAAESASHSLAVELLMECPLDLAPEQVLPIIEALSRSDANNARRGAFEACCAFLGPGRASTLAHLDMPSNDEHLQRMRHLALSWAEPTDDQVAPTMDTPVGVIEAALLRQTAWSPNDASAVLDMLAAWDGEPRPAFEYILRYSRDPRAGRALKRLADAGSKAARYALQSRSESVDETQARLVATDASQPPARRRLAAWRRRTVPPDTLAEILSLDPAEADGSVHAAALLAERHLTPSDAAAQAETWIRSFNDDEKRAGALLAALLDKHQELLEQAYGIEDIGAVRTTQRLALWALGRPVEDDDPKEFAYRALHRKDGDFNPDTALCMLLAGEAETLRLLTSRPTGDWAESVRRRALLIERFLPAWHEATGRPIGGDVRALQLHFDRLDALRMLNRRRLRFEPEGRIYTAASAVGADSK